MAKININKNKILLTEEGLVSLKGEYDNLTEVERPAVLQAIQDARSMGDLSENGMYSAAREQQAFVEGRIREIEDILKKVEIVAENNNSTIGLGSKVRIETQKQKLEYHIVGPEEVNMAGGKISHESPLGQALIGKKVGDFIEFEAPMGTVQYKVLEVK